MTFCSLVLLEVLHLVSEQREYSFSSTSIKLYHRELKPKLAKIKTEVKDIKKQLLVIHLSLVNEVRHSEKSYLSISTPFQHKYPFQNQKNKNPPPLYDIKTQKEV